MPKNTWTTRFSPNPIELKKPQTNQSINSHTGQGGTNNWKSKPEPVLTPHQREKNRTIDWNAHLTSTSCIHTTTWKTPTWAEWQTPNSRRCWTQMPKNTWTSRPEPVFLTTKNRRVGMRTEQIPHPFEQLKNPNTSWMAYNTEFSALPPTNSNAEEMRNNSIYT